GAALAWRHLRLADGRRPARLDAALPQPGFRLAAAWPRAAMPYRGRGRRPRALVCRPCLRDRRHARPRRAGAARRSGTVGAAAGATRGAMSRGLARGSAAALTPPRSSGYIRPATSRTIRITRTRPTPPLG